MSPGYSGGEFVLAEQVISQEGVVCSQEAVTRPNCAVQFSPSLQP